MFSFEGSPNTLHPEYGSHLSHTFEKPSTSTEKPRISLEKPSFSIEKPGVPIRKSSFWMWNSDLD